jgi:hypothetical protein
VRESTVPKLKFAAAMAACIALIGIVSNSQFANGQSKTQPDPFANFAASLTAVPALQPLANKGTVYVPAFSSLRVAAGKTRVDFAVTLSIHNASESDPLVLHRIDYFDTSGALVQHYITQPIALKPFGTVEVFIPAEDIRGGTGANFIVGWAAAGPIAEPVVETVMLGNIGTAGFSFTSVGRAIRIVKDNK